MNINHINFAIEVLSHPQSADESDIIAAFEYALQSLKAQRRKIIKEWMTTYKSVHKAKKEDGDLNHDATTKALELEHKLIIDKIRAEIMDTGAYEQEVRGSTEFLEGINYCLSVINKHTSERDDKK